jgi:hypothetical protein
VAVLEVVVAVLMLIVMGNQLAPRRLLRTREVLRALRKRWLAGPNDTSSACRFSRGQAHPARVRRARELLRDLLCFRHRRASGRGDEPAATTRPHRLLVPRSAAFLGGRLGFFWFFFASWCLDFWIALAPEKSIFSAALIKVEVTRFGV